MSNTGILRHGRELLGGLSPELRLLFRLIGVLPLRVVQSARAVLGRVAFAFARRERARLEDGLRAAGLGTPEMAGIAAAEAGKTLIEMIWFWQKPQHELVSLVRDVEGEHWVTTAHTRGKGIIFLTPHLGCFEIAAHFAASYAPITVLYRPPRQRAIRSFAQLGRARGNIRLVETDTRGATALLSALRRGEWVGILPDQVPTRGEGEWAEFFGRPAYTMTLSTRLQQRTDAAVILCFCERLARGGGYRIHLEPLPPLADGESAVRGLNRSLDNLIRKKPEQYLWSYNRYKAPPGTTPPPAFTDAADGKAAGSA
jgi:Kdo2-lipid IVA lauroyltransferase/acyltransferase